MIKVIVLNMESSKANEKVWRSKRVTCLIDNCTQILRRDCLLRHIKDKHEDHHNRMKEASLRVTEGKEFKLGSMIGSDQDDNPNR